MTEEAAREYVQAILDAQHPLIQTVAFKSRLRGWRPGQTLRVTLPRRHVDQVFVIRSVKMGVEASMAPGEDLELLSSIEAISGTAIRGQFEQVYKDWLGKGSSVSGASLEPAVGPVYDLQYFGDYRPTTYNDGDIVVGPDGIVYLCVLDGVTTPPTPWVPTGDGTIRAAKYFELDRITALGYWQDVPFNAGNFAATAPMIFTVTASQIIFNRYSLIGKTLHWSMMINGASLSGAATGGIVLVLPAGLVSNGGAIAGVLYNAGAWRTVIVYSSPGQSAVNLTPIGATTFVSPDSPVYLWLSVAFEVQ
jgi:hypothetical protein